jgi:predicted glutamine amidotransferase
MSNFEVKIKEPLCSIIKDKSFDSFTVTQLRNSFLKIQGNELTEKEARILVYKQILRLLKRGFLSKSSTSKGARDAIYSKTPLFYETAIIPYGEYVNTDKTRISENNGINFEKKSANDDVVNNLKEQVKGDKVDLISSISESEEYLRLIKAFPQAKDYLHSKYLDASERSSQFLGKIRATKNLLNYLSEE